MKIEINCRGWAAVVHVFEILIMVCMGIFGFGRLTGVEINAMDPMEMTYLVMIIYLAVLWLFVNKARHQLEKIAEKEDEKNRSKKRGTSDYINKP